MENANGIGTIGTVNQKSRRAIYHVNSSKLSDSIIITEFVILSLIFQDKHVGTATFYIHLVVTESFKSADDEPLNLSILRFRVSVQGN